MHEISLQPLLRDFPVGIVIISASSFEDGGSIQYLNEKALRILEISESVDEEEINSSFISSVLNFKQRELDKLSDLTLFDFIFNSSLSNSADNFYSSSMMIYVKKQVTSNAILLSLDDYGNERETIREKLIKSISFQHLNTMYHELNNPLNSLINSVEEIDPTCFPTLQLSVYLIKTVIKKFILYSKVIFDSFFDANNEKSIFNLQFMFTKIANGFSILFKYRNIDFNIEESFLFLNSIAFRTDSYYLKEFIRNIFLYLYYKIPKNSKLTIKHNINEKITPHLLTISFTCECPEEMTTLIKNESSCDRINSSESMEISQTVKSIEMSQEILIKIAKALEIIINFPEDQNICVIEFPDFIKEDAMSESESNEDIDEFNPDILDLPSVPIFDALTTFSYLKESMKGIGKNSSKMVNRTSSSELPRPLSNSGLGPAMQRKKTYQKSNQPLKSIESLKRASEKYDNKHFRTIKKQQTLNSLHAYMENIKDPIIDNLKAPVISSFTKPLKSNGNPSVEFQKNFKTFCKRDIKRCSGAGLNNILAGQDGRYALNKFASPGANSSSGLVNVTRGKFLKKKTVVKADSEYDRVATKRFPSKYAIQILPSQKEEACATLNNSFSRMKTKVQGTPLDVPVFAKEFEKHQSPRVVRKSVLECVDILLVDDEEFNLACLQSLLKLERLLADTATNGEECINRIKSKSDYKLIFMDIYMPIMDGIKASTIIDKMVKEKKINEKLVIIIVSAHAKETFEGQLNQLNVVKKFIQKPLTRKKLKTILQEYYY